MSSRNSIICIAKDIKIDRNYKNTLSLSANEIAGLMESGVHNLYYGSDYSFLRTERRIKVQTPFSQIFDGNYCYIVNQGIRQFFFIDQVNYIADSTTEIIVTEDVLTTYKHNGFNRAYCERQHPQDDTRFSNTIAEPINPSNYVSLRAHTIDVNPVEWVALLSERYASESPSTDEGFYQPSYTQLSPNQHCIMDYVRGDLTAQSFQGFISYYWKYIEKGKAGDLVSLYLRPTPTTHTVTLNLPASLDGYIPKNNKLFNSPYTIYQLSNNAGSTINYKPELFNSLDFECIVSDNGKPQAFCYPAEYMNRYNNYDYGLIIDNYPIIPVPVDSYTEWLGQSQAGVTQGLIGSAVMAGLSVALAPVTGGLSLMGLAGAVTGIGSQLTEAATHIDNTPDTVVGRSSGSIINQALQSFNFIIETQTVTRDQAIAIDDFFTRFGYAQNCIMQISQTNPRFHCHYVKTASGECVIHGIPHEKQDIINNAFNSGVTFWDSNDNVGNYNLK